MKMWEYLGVAPEQVLRQVIRPDYIEVIFERDGQRSREKIANAELTEEPLAEEAVDATDGARDQAAAYGIDLAEIYKGKRLTAWDIRGVIDAE